MSLQSALDNTAKAASKRAAEGQKLFSPVAAFLDKHLSSSADLPPHLLRALNALSTELSSVAQRHFDAYISGAATPSAQRPTRSPSPPPTRPPSGLSQSTYAAVASSNAPAKSIPLAGTTQTKAPRKSLPREPAPDNRLFVRLPNSHAARDLQGYAVLTSLRAHLGPDGPLLREVQTTKTGFALCPASPDALKTLESRKDAIHGLFGDCLVERGSRWVSYRVTNVPRRVGQITGCNKYDLVPVDSNSVAQAVHEATGLTPAAVTETTYSVSNPTLPYSCWFVNFPEGTPATLPRQIRLFGTVATATFLPRKTAIVQCNRCWMWHNARSCSRPPRCRLCGSTEHPEGAHSNRCNAPSPHLCPPRCLHCHGPHPADATDCPLRLRPGSAPTKLQRSEIRSSCAAKHTRARAEAGCLQPPAASADQMAIDPSITASAATASPAPTFTLTRPYASPYSTQRPGTPPPQPPLQHPPSTARAVRTEDRPTSPVPSNPFQPLSSTQI
jgi:hypothetical protein